MNSTSAAAIFELKAKIERLHRVGVAPVTDNRLYVRASKLDAYPNAAVCCCSDHP